MKPHSAMEVYKRHPTLFKLHIVGKYCWICNEWISLRLNHHRHKHVQTQPQHQTLHYSKNDASLFDMDIPIND